MPDPRPIGNTARKVLRDLSDIVESNIGTISQIKHQMHLGNVEKAQKAQEDATYIQMVVLRVLTSLVVQDTLGAEEILTEHLKRKDK